jgi:ankyrin repeat protein
MMWEECYTDFDIRRSLENLPKDLSETYRHCIDRINQRHSGLAYKMLFWVCVATKPFTMPQMQEVLAMDHKTGLSEPENSMPAREVLKLCSHLVIQDTDGKLRPTHYSVNQFLEEDSGTTNTTSWADRTLATAKVELGQLCVVHLLSPIYQRAVQRYQKPDDLTDGRGVLGTIQKHVPYAWLLRPSSSRSKPLKIPWPPNVQSTTTVMKPPKFFSFARDNWAPLMDWIDNTSKFYDKFRAIALENSFTWRVHPWESIGDSFGSHMVGLLGWAIAHKHSPLFELMRDPASPKLRRDVFNIPLYHYNNVPLLHLAARTDFITAVEELVRLSKPRLLDHKKRLAIHHAAEAGSVMAMNVLLQSMEPYINVQDNDGHSPLHLAACSNCYAIVDALLNCSEIRINPLDIHRRTPLFYALENSGTAVVEALLYREAHVNSRDAAGRTPVFVAAAKLNDRALELLVEQGADVHALDKDGYQPMHFAVSTCLQLGSHKIGRGRTTAALIKSIKDVNNSALKCLLQVGANPDGDKYTHEVPIIVAVQVGNCDAVDLLTKAGGAIDTYNDALNHTPLSLAYHLGHHDIVETLRRRGATMEYRLILQAVRLGQLDVVRLLVDETTEAITLACFQDHPEVITSLFRECRVRPDIIVSTLLNHNGTLAKCILKRLSKSDYQSPQLLLAIAAGSGAVQVVHSLLNTIAVPDSTALVAAISMRFVPTIQVLLQRGAPIGLRALECALESGLIEVSATLVNFGATPEQVYFDPPERGHARKDTIDETRGSYALQKR